MEELRCFPFAKLVTPPDEEVRWCGFNPTFHRGSSYGIAVSDRAIYLFSPFWAWFARWRRYPLADVTGVHFQDSYWLPRLIVKLGKRTVTFRTPYDGHQDEMDFDRENLSRAAKLISESLGGA